MCSLYLKKKKHLSGWVFSSRCNQAWAWTWFQGALLVSVYSSCRVGCSTPELKWLVKDRNCRKSPQATYMLSGTPCPSAVNRLCTSSLSLQQNTDRSLLLLQRLFLAVSSKLPVHWFAQLPGNANTTMHLQGHYPSLFRVKLSRNMCSYIQILPTFVILENLRML